MSLHNRVKLNAPLTLEQMNDPDVLKIWQLPRTNFRSAGTLDRPLHYLEAEEFWNAVLDSNFSIIDIIEHNLLAN